MHITSGSEKVLPRVNFLCYKDYPIGKIRSFSIFEDATVTRLARKVKIVSITVNAHVKLVMLELRAINVNITFIVHHLIENVQVFVMFIIVFVFCCF